MQDAKAQRGLGVFALLKRYDCAKSCQVKRQESMKSCQVKRQDCILEAYCINLSVPMYGENEETVASKFHQVIEEKLSEFYEQGIPSLFRRDLSLGTVPEPQRHNLVQVIVGVRRCGKTYRLYQEMQQLLEKGVELRDILYFNFDDERLKPYETSLLNDVLESFYARNPQARTRGAYLFFDEIQEVPEWGAFMRRVVDDEKVCLYVTGSSSKMLSSHLASEFRGRALSRELFPLSFAEYVRFHTEFQEGLQMGLHTEATEVQRGLNNRDFDNGHLNNKSLSNRGVNTDFTDSSFSSAQQSLLKHSLQRYLYQGGFIAAQNLDSSDAVQLLQEYANRAINYDIIERYNISNPRAAMVFLARCLASSGRELSVNKVFNEFKSRQISVSRELLAHLLSYYEESYLLFTVKNYSVALSDNARSVAKVYAVDPAIFGAFSPAGSKEYGQRLETAVFNKLRRATLSVRPGAISRVLAREASQRYEIDFVMGDALALEEQIIVQVCVSLSDSKTREREVRACNKAMGQFGVKQSVIVTEDEEETIEVSNGVIQAVPAWKWLL